jgi:hypothetical protein
MQLTTPMQLDPAFLSQPQFQVAQDILASEVDNELILLHIGSGSYYSLNETTLPFLQALEQQLPLAGALEQVIQEYAVERQQVLNDLHILLRTLQDYGLILPLNA